MKKTIIAVICLVTVITVTILPTFAWANSGDAAGRERCVFVFNGKENKFKTTCNSGLIVTNRIPIATGPRLLVRSDTGNITNAYPMQEQDYTLYLRLDDNEQVVELSVFNPSSNTYTNYDALTSTVYFFYEGGRQPTVYNQNIENICNAYWNAFYKYLPIWECFKTTALSMQILPTNQKNVILENMADFELQQEYERGYQIGYGEGRELGVSEGINTKTSFLEGLQMIVTTPGYFINSIFDFELFGFNIANVIRSILTLALVGVVIFLFVKFL